MLIVDCDVTAGHWIVAVDGVVDVAIAFCKITGGTEDCWYVFEADWRRMCVAGSIGPFVISVTGLVSVVAPVLPRS